MTLYSDGFDVACRAVIGCVCNSCLTERIIYTAFLFYSEVIFMECCTDLYQRFGSSVRALVPGFELCDYEIESVIDSHGVDFFVQHSGDEMSELFEAALLISNIKRGKGAYGNAS
jgi:hypothetical protein